MVDTTDSAKLEIVKLPNGRYAVQTEGQATPADEDGDFETQAEAEAWMYGRTQQMDAAANDLGILTPGGGQGVR